MTEVIEKNNINNQRLIQDQLGPELAQLTGTDQWYRHNINRKLIYIDGVKFLAENGGEQGAYWFIDKVACEIAPLLQSINKQFGCISLNVGLTDKDQAMILVTDGNEKELVNYHIHFTDMQLGNWKFYLIDDETHITLLLPSEFGVVSEFSLLYTEGVYANNLYPFIEYQVKLFSFLRDKTLYCQLG